jgi:hypothetical protein
VPPGIFQGRPWPAPGEPLWHDDDRAWALALALEEANDCPSCGWPLDETTDPDTEERWRTAIVRCHRCTAREVAGHQHGQSPGIQPGFLVRTTLTGPRPEPKV